MEVPEHKGADPEKFTEMVHEKLSSEPVEQCNSCGRMQKKVNLMIQLAGMLVLRTLLRSQKNNTIDEKNLSPVDSIVCGDAPFV